MDLAPLESHSEAASQKTPLKDVDPDSFLSLANGSSSNLDSCAHPRWLTFTRAAPRYGHGRQITKIEPETSGAKKREVRRDPAKEERRHRGETDSEGKEVAGDVRVGGRHEAALP